MIETLMAILPDDVFAGIPEYSCPHYDVTDNLLAMAGWSGALGVLVVILLLLVLLLLNSCDKRVKFVIPGKVLTTAFVVVWLAGFVIYDVGTYIGHSRWSLVTNAPMAIMHAFEMFLVESSVDAIHEQFHDNWIFMAFFSLVHFLASIITLLFVIKHFGYNIIAGFRMLFEAYVMRKKRDTYVFWGLNDASYLLARSIIEHNGPENRDYRLIVVRTHHDGEKTSVKNGMERLFNFLSINNNDMERLRDLDCLTTSTYTDLTDVALNGMDAQRGTDILRRHLNLNQLARIIGRKTTGSVHMFFLSDDDNKNIQAVGNLKRDSTILAAGINAVFYCKARYNSVHRVIEDEQHQDNIIVKVIDPSHISVEMLKEDVALQPVSYVDIERDATVSSAFNALVVGFGEVGHDAVRFLYEFGAFVKTGSDKDNVERSAFHCDVIDKNIRNLAGPFAVNAPSVSQQMSYGNESAAHPTLITLHDLDIHSVTFYSHIERMIKELNYVVIALDDDEENVSLAVRIFRLAIRYRDNMEHFRILARVRNDDGGHLMKIIEHYNRLWAAECASDKSGHLHQHVVDSYEQRCEPLTLFGLSSSIYTWNNVVSENLKSQAIRFKEKYVNTLAATGVNRPDWNMEHNELMQLTDEFKGFSPTYSGIMRLRRVQRQNMSNCFHQFTKQMLASCALGDNKMTLLKHLSRAVNETAYQWQGHDPDGDVVKVLDVLAQTEHLRWIASHEILGYRDDGTEADKDEARLLHGCLKPWNQLSIPVKSYDYNVVDVSLGIANK